MILARAVLIAAFPVLAGAQGLSVAEKASIHLERVVSPLSLAGSVAGAGIEQFRDDPPEWGNGGAGYGRRLASVQGYIAVQNLFAFTLDSALREDPRYIPSGRSGVWNRVQYALLNTILTRTDSGRRTFSYWRAGSQIGASLLSNTWYPDPYNSVADGFTRGAIAIGYDAASNVAREFWPDIRRKVFRR